MQTVSNSKIRAGLLSEDHVLRVRITRKGDIHIYTTTPRGDGGESPWWMYLGCVQDFYI